MPSQLAELAQHQAPTEPATPGELVYMYAILPAQALTSLPTICMDDDQPIYVLADEQLQAVVSRLRPEVFGEAALKNNLQRAAWLETHVRAHQRVLDHLVATGKPILPLRFCTIYRNEAAAHSMLAAHQAELWTELERLAYKKEWGVKLFVDPEALQLALCDNHPALQIWQGNDEIATLQTQIAHGSRGAAFLLKKKLATALAKAIETTAFALADTTHVRLAQHAVEAVTSPLQQKCPEMHLNAAYLVANTAFAGFRQELDQLGEMYGAVGVRYELSGPWPAYHFLNLNLHG